MQKAIIKRELDCGLRVIVQPLPESRVVSVVLGVDVGSADEGARQFGAAHFVEHMLFKGTSRRGLGQIDEEVESIGGAINAYTSHDETVYYATVRPERWTDVLDVLVDMVQGSLFRREDIEVERDVILDELRGVEESPTEILGRVVSKTLWPEHPYGRPVGALIDDVAALEGEDIVAFWRKWYRPERMILSIAGPVEMEEAFASAVGLFNPPETTLERVRPEAQTCRQGGVVLEAHDFRDSVFEVAFPAVDLQHADAPALDLLATLLGGSEASPLMVRLQLETGLVNVVWAVASARADAGALYVGCSPRKGKESEALAELWSVINDFVAHGVSPEELARAKALIVGERRLSLQTSEEKALDACWYEIFFGDPSAGNRYSAEISAVSIQRLQQLARTVLKPDSATAAMVGTKEALAASGLQGMDRKGVSSAKVGSSRIQRVLDSGARLLIESGGDGHLSAIRVLGLGGRLLENPKTAGFSRVWGAGVVCGAGPMTNREFADRLSLRGAGLAAGSFSPSMKLGIDCGREVMDEALEWLAWLLFEPHFESSEIERLRREALEGLEGLEDRPGTLAWQELNQQLFGQHPYGLAKMGTPDSISTLHAESLRSLHMRWFVPENLVFSIVGTGEAERVADRFERLFVGLKQREGQVPDVPTPEFPQADLERIVYAGREQSQVILAWGTAGLDALDRRALDLAAGCLGSPGGRLFQSIRDRYGLGYHVDADNMAAPKAGLFSLSMATEHTRSEEARDRLMEQLQLVADEGVAAEELERAKARILFGRLEALQLPGSRAAEIAYWERCEQDGFDRVERELSALEALTAEDVQASVCSLLEDSARVCVRSLPKSKK